MQIEEILIDAVSHGYLLHGSAHLIDNELQPRQANDSAKIGGNLCGIYATTDIAVAMFKAIAKRPEKSSSLMGWDFDDENDSKRVYGTNISFVAGYIYILPPDNFSAVLEDDSEFVSMNKVLPIDKIKIQPEQFYQFAEEHNILINITAK